MPAVRRRLLMVRRRLLALRQRLLAVHRWLPAVRRRCLWGRLAAVRFAAVGGVQEKGGVGGKGGVGAQGGVGGGVGGGVFRDGLSAGLSGALSACRCRMLRVPWHGRRLLLRHRGALAAELRQQKFGGGGMCRTVRWRTSSRSSGVPSSRCPFHRGLCGRRR